jgi:DNA (cytosine-5)-methyltransferase 1
VADVRGADPRMPAEERLAVLVEEVGEVARELCDARAEKREPAPNLRVELVQVAAIRSWLGRGPRRVHTEGCGVTFVVTDEMIDACGFRMFALDEIARTMVMHEHPAGGDYAISGNKRERMAKYGNAVTPPATRLKLTRLAEVLGGGFTFSDLFCGAGGSSIGATLAGGELLLGVNHWRSAIDDHAENFPDADHDCADVSALTTAQIRRYPDSDVLLASPECTNHSLAKGARRRKPQAASLWEDGPAGDDEQDRSRATMWDVCRFAEQKLLKGKPYKAIVVENVVDAFRWGADDNGLLFAAWRSAIESMGYRSEIVWLNSMFAWPTPQSRDRMYVVFVQNKIRRPNLEIEPVSWCPSCERVVNGRRVWKRPARPHETAQGKPVGARYGVQYLFGCPDCRAIVLPAVYPAATAIDFSIPAPLIGDRDRPLKVNSYERVRRGLVKILSEPFAIRLTHGGIPKPLTLPLVTLTQRHDMAMVIPVAGNTSGNRARDAATRPLDTVHGTLEQALGMANTENGVPRPAGRESSQTLRTEGGLAMVVPNRANNVPRDAALEASAPILTGGTIGLVELQNHGSVRDVEIDPSGTMRAGGFHHALVMRNNTARGDQGQMSTPTHEPFRTLTGACHQSLVVPYGRTTEARGDFEPMPTQMTRERFALVVPPSSNGTPRDAFTDPSFVQVTETRPMLVEIPESFA